MKWIKGFLAVLLLAAVAAALSPFISGPSGPSHQGRSAEAWLDEAVLKWFEKREIIENHRNAFLAMGEKGSKFLAQEILKKEDWVNKIMEPIPPGVMRFRRLNEFRLKNLQESRRYVASEILASLGPNAGPAIGMLLDELDRLFIADNARPKHRLQFLMGRFLPKAGPALDPWIPTLLEQWRRHPSNREWIAWMLVTSGPRAQAALPLILEEIKDSPKSRPSLVKYAGFIATESPDLVAASIEFLQDSSYDEAFSDTFQIPGIQPITSFPDRDLLRAASFVLGNLKTGDSVDLNVLQSCMIWRDPAIRGNLIRAMGRFEGDPNTLLDGIQPFFNDENPMIRLRAAQAWTQVSRDRELPSNIVNQLREESPNETPLETVTRQGVQWRVNGHVEPLLRAIVNAFTEDEDEVRLEAVEWLIEIHAKSPLARSLLEKALKDTNGLIRFRAEEALKRGE